MPRKRHSPEEIVTKLHQVDLMASEGKSIATAVKTIGMTGAQVGKPPAHAKDDQNGRWPEHATPGQRGPFRPLRSSYP